MNKITKDEALKPVLTLALEALELYADYEGKTSIADKAIAAIREALASKSEALAHAPEVREQPAQQQAGHTFYDGNGNVVAHLDATSEITMDYTKPCAWSYKETGRNGIYTPAQQQEPVAYMNQNGVVHPADYEWEGVGNILTPLYTSPPASKRWVGLTEAQAGAMWKKDTTPYNFYRAIEAKLREKNA